MHTSVGRKKNDVELRIPSDLKVGVGEKNTFMVGGEIFHRDCPLPYNYITHSGNCRFKAGNTGQGAEACKFSGLLQVKGAF